MSFEDDKHLEARLRALRPVEPAGDIALRIEESLRRMERRRQVTRFGTWLAWGSMAAAACLLISFGVLLFNGRFSPLVTDENGEVTTVTPAPLQPVAAGNGYQPVLAENNLKGRVDEGIVFLRNGLTARRYRYEFVDRVVWQNPADGSQIEYEIPRDEVILIPVQTF